MFLSSTHENGESIGTSNVPISRNDWLTICTSIASQLQVLRERWFRSFLNVIKKYSSKKVVNSALEGDAELALKAYQLYLVSGFLAGHDYIPQHEGKDFADLLYAQVCGTQLPECLRFLERYHEVGSDTSEEVSRQIFRVASDVSEYILGGENPWAEARRLMHLFPEYGLVHHLVVANSFGDDQTVQIIREGITKMQSQEDELAPKESPQSIQPPQSQMALMKKNPIVAFILGVIFGPLGYLYIGWRYALLAFGVILVFTLVINVAGFPLPVWVPYVVLFVFGYKAHTICSARNELVERGEFDQVQNLNSFPFAVMAMSDLLVGIGLFYTAILGLWVSVLLILGGSVLAGLAMLFIGTPILVWISSLVFGLIALGVDSLAGGDENIFRS